MKVCSRIAQAPSGLRKFVAGWTLRRIIITLNRFIFPVVFFRCGQRVTVTEQEGGENALLDPEIAYIRMRDENPDFIAAFMHDEAMTIPTNVERNGKVRAESVGPVFSVSPQTATLQMRYTARGRNILWRDTPATLAAVKFLSGLLADGDPLIFRHKLVPGQGLICNNVLHNRTGFKSAPERMVESERLIYRVRYLDRISGACSINDHEDNYGPTE